MGENSISLTYELLYEIVRKEKTNADLQKLDQDIYEKIINYINDKKQVFKTTIKDSSAPENEKEKIKTQFNNIRRLIKELFERREKKLIVLAINKSRTNAANLDLSALIEEEKVFFDIAVSILNKFRKDVLLNLINASMPTYIPDKQKQPQENPDLKNDSENKTQVKFIGSIQKFFGPELEIYGPFKPGDTAELPNKIADLLVRKNMVSILK
ncbi:DNA replication complex GINS family protein [Candidatus Woesearchaeota archaeon]|nr:DNA replication complex GINS family protein [Candidatus Woesearchaeota archaeon]